MNGRFSIIYYDVYFILFDVVGQGAPKLINVCIRPEACMSMVADHLHIANISNNLTARNERIPVKKIHFHSGVNYDPGIE